MGYQIEKLLNRQIELIARLQDKAEEVLNLKTSPDSAEATVAYFEALESATESLESLAEFYEDYEDMNFEDEDEDEDEEEEY
jgi:succinate dehydrogenase/fumarate reductase flavoprotein subunit